jgi:microsomal dipeptidase-like Zn-dependent dipeptidase
VAHDVDEVGRAMKFLPEPTEDEAVRFIDYFMSQIGEGCTPRLAIGSMAAITPIGQRILAECARRDIPVDLRT